MNIALLTAAGSGSRMGQEVPKQFLHINDKPVIIYTMERFQESPLVDAIIVVTLSHWADFVWSYAKQFKITKLKWVISGGSTGQESIRNGLLEVAKTCPPEETTIMVHDGNRPMVDNDIISDSLSVYKKHGSAVAVIPCTEAVFKSEDGEVSDESIPREMLFRTQTPHTYKLSKLLWAHEEAVKRGITNTAASCSLMNQLGETVHFSRGSEKNIKLTTIDDIDIFKALLRNEKSGWML